MWLDAQKYHIIDVFWGFNLPSLNLAKIGHASLKKGLSHNSQVRLTDVAYFDTSSMMMQDAEYLNVL